MDFVEIFISASNLGTGILSASFYYDDCGNQDYLLTSSSGTETEFSRDQFINGITLNVPVDATTLHVKPTNKECRACEDSIIVLN